MNNEDIDKFFDELNLQLKQIRDYKQENLKLSKDLKDCQNNINEALKKINDLEEKLNNTENAYQNLHKRTLHILSKFKN